MCLTYLLAWLIAAPVLPPEPPRLQICVHVHATAVVHAAVQRSQVTVHVGMRSGLANTVKSLFFPLIAQRRWCNVLMLKIRAHTWRHCEAVLQNAALGSSIPRPCCTITRVYYERIPMLVHELAVGAQVTV
jgi:hypothetical protein